MRASENSVLSNGHFREKDRWIWPIGGNCGEYKGGIGVRIIHHEWCVLSRAHRRSRRAKTLSPCATKNLGPVARGLLRPRPHSNRPCRCESAPVTKLSALPWLRLFVFATLGSVAAPARGQTPRFTHFEARHTHSIALTPDGTRLLAVNSPAGRLSVFDVSNPAATPALIHEIAVGLEPVAVRARTDDEVWVVNEVGDSVSVVSLSRGVVVATLPTKDEPADIVFAQGKAFVSCARDSVLRVFDAITRQELAPIPLDGLDPRALTTDAAGTKLYAAFLLSGNGTTILPRSSAPAQPAPTDPTLPAAPAASLIVATDDPRIDFTVLDRDAAEIDPVTGTVTRYFTGGGTNLFDLAVHPSTGELWLANTEARNLIRFEPVLRGHFADNRLTKFTPDGASKTIHDLNPGVDYAMLPNPAAQATALAQPTGLVFSASGNEAWVAAFGSDRVAKIEPATGAVLARVDVRTGGGSSAVMRGPRALALHSTQPRLYVLNKLTDSITVVATDTESVVTEVALSLEDLMPATIRAGRGFLFDARLSGNGTASCATCHLDADRDGLAWDLGDPSGAMQIVIGINNSAHSTIPRERVMHPMKGPMVTQTLRGIPSNAILHWRGDKPNVQAFNPTFDKLMGGSQIAAADADALAAYVHSLRNHPNPHRLENGMLPLSFNGGNPRRGQDLFNTEAAHCFVCHSGTLGTDNNVDLMSEVGASQPLKTPPLGTTYQRLLLDPRPGMTSLSGFGVGHDGSGFELPTVHPYPLDSALTTPADFADVTAFVLAFDTGTSPAVGQSVTVGPVPGPGVPEILTRFETMIPGTADLVVEGIVGGVMRRFNFSRSRKFYVSSIFGEAPLTRSALLELLSGNDALTFRMVQPMEAARFADQLDRQAVLAPDSYFVKSKTAVVQIPAATGLMANDLQVTSLTDSAVVFAASTGGTAVVNVDGSFTYTPQAAFAQTGLDGFTYQVQIASDLGNLTSPTTATISTLASAAGRYTGHILTAGGDIAGFADVTVGASGSWSGKLRIGGKLQTLRGKLELDGLLRVVAKIPPPVTLRLLALPTGERRINARIESEGATLTSLVQRSSFNKTSPAPGAGTHPLALTVASTIGTAPTTPGTAKLTLSKLGVVRLAGKLGEKTAFTCSGVATARPGGGWLFEAYAPVYKYPPGSASGTLAYDSAQPLVIEGSIEVIKPPQTKKSLFQEGFTIDYAVSKVPKP